MCEKGQETSILYYLYYTIIDSGRYNRISLLQDMLYVNKVYNIVHKNYRMEAT